jgi:hypothetical protein
VVFLLLAATWLVLFIVCDGGGRPVGYAELLDPESAEALRADAALMGSCYLGGQLEGLPDRLSDTPLVLFASSPRRWCRVVLPGEIGRALHGAVVYAVAGSGNGRELVGIRDTMPYRLPLDLTVLLADGGFVYSDAEVADWMHTYSFFMIAARRLGLTSAYLDVEVPPQVDSVMRGLVPLVPDYRVEIERVEVAKETEPDSFVFTPRGAIARVSATVSWHDQRTPVTVELWGAAGREGRSFPREWLGVFPTQLTLPSPPDPGSQD